MHKAPKAIAIMPYILDKLYSSALNEEFQNKIFGLRIRHNPAMNSTIPWIRVMCFIYLTQSKDICKYIEIINIL